MTASGAKFSLAIISRVDSWRASSAEIAPCTSGSVSARLPPSTGSAVRRASVVCTTTLIRTPLRLGGSPRLRREPTSGVSGAQVEVLGDPLVEQTDVVLAGHQHPTLGVRPGIGRELAPLGGVEVLL